MNASFPHRHAPLPLRNGIRLRNRVVVPPMASETADEAGFVTERTLAHYARLAQSGASLVMVEYSFVERSGRSEANQLGIALDAQVEGLRRLAAVIRAAGAVAGIQITHAGAKSSRDLTGGVLEGPSSVAVPVKDREMEAPEAMAIERVRGWKRAFVAAALRARAAGFDLVELHAAHGYGLNQWLSAITNRREDSYGGSAGNRARLLLETVEEIRAQCPELLLAVRMPGQDFMDGGLSPGDAIGVARALEARGVDLLDVSSGIGGWRRPRDRRGEGYLVEEAARIQSEVALPVIGVGGIQTGRYIDEALARGWLGLAAVGRAILEDPRGWGERELGPSAASDPVEAMPVAELASG